MRLRRPEQGFSLIELMIGMTIGLFILLGVLIVYVGAVRTYSTNDALSRVQESGRFAIEILSKDIREAGFTFACTTGVNNLLNESGSGYDGDLFDLSNGIVGWDNNAGDYAAVLTGYAANTDVLQIKHAADDAGVTASGNTPANANTINLTGASGISKGTILLVADVSGCDLFQNRSADTDNTLTRGASNNNPGPGNKNPGAHDFSHEYEDDMEIFRLRSAIYYIGQGVNNRPALRRIRFDQGTGGAAWNEEVVSDIEDMQIQYGIDTDGDENVDRYESAAYIDTTAGVDWDNVLSVRVRLLAASANGNVLEVQQNNLLAPFAAIDTSDRRLRQVFTATIAIRNRLP